jgi:hypothetical protein
MGLDKSRQRDLACAFDLRRADGHRTFGKVAVADDEVRAFPTKRPDVANKNICGHIRSFPVFSHKFCTLGHPVEGPLRTVQNRVLVHADKLSPAHENPAADNSRIHIRTVGEAREPLQRVDRRP